MPDIKAITLALPFGLGTVNCYLIKTGAGYILIDTGSSNQRAAHATVGHFHWIGSTRKVDSARCWQHTPRALKRLF